jgi:hypothetical protein
MGIEETIKAINELTRYANKGMLYDEDMNIKNGEILQLKNKIKTNKNEHTEKTRKLLREIDELKSSHPDYIKIQCRCCDGAGGFDCGEQSEACSACGGDGFEYIKKDVI